MKKFCCIKMTKVASSIFGEGKRIKVFKVFNRIGNNFVKLRLIKMYELQVYYLVKYNRTKI